MAPIEGAIATASDCGRHESLFAQGLPDGANVPAIAVTRHATLESSKVRAKLERAIITVFKQSLAVDAQQFLCFLNGHPSVSRGHGVVDACLNRIPNVKTLSTALRKILSLWFVPLHMR